MNPKVLLLAAALTAPAQDPFAGSSRNPAPFTESKAMLEDMETMRLVLSRKLNATTPHTNQYTGVYDAANVVTNPNVAPANPAAQTNGLMLSGMGGAWQQSGRSYLSTIEALYLPRIGVVFAATMPPVKGDPRVNKDAAPKSEKVTDWDRARNSLEGKTAAASAAPQRREPPLAEVLLRALAENASHFRELPDDESITIVVTFRKPAGDANVDNSNRLRMGDYVTGSTNNPAAQNSGSSALFGGMAPLAKAGSSAMGVPAGGGGDGTADYDAVADLHIKRGNYAEAIKIYTDAVKMRGAEADKLSGDPANAAALSSAMQQLRSAYSRLAQAQLAAGKYDEAKATLEAARNADANMRNPRVPLPVASPARPPLPARLTISGMKRHLVAAGSSELLIEDLTKAATVHYSDPATK